MEPLTLTVLVTAIASIIPLLRGLMEAIENWIHQKRTSGSVELHMTTKEGDQITVNFNPGDAKSVDAVLKLLKEEKFSQAKPEGEGTSNE